ncbi:hypothetical protein [Streptomyces sp. NPDC051567]|uniref:hypothetical protein n=1 Tax=Streptomyces sp. NPDC051567 TaxID=3365660 RepID=UPI00378E2C03
MAEAVPVRCPACLRESNYTAPVFPCACGSPVVPPLDLTAPPLTLTHRTWSGSWVAVRCAACARESEWPHPELGCGSCGTVVLIPVHPLEPQGPPPGGSGPRADAADGGRSAPPPSGTPPHPHPRPGQAVPAPRPTPRPDFRPVTIRTARDAVTAAALYLRWLGFEDVHPPEARPAPAAAVDLRAPGLVAQVDPTTAPAGLRAVECVWLNGLTASATSVYFALAGYTEDARTRADALGIPLFVMDLTGTPQPVNDPADELVGRGS